MRRLVALTTLALASLSGTAVAAGPPTMPLSQVTRGMHCTATTVVQGTTLSTFDVDILDIVGSGGSDHSSDLILFKASGPVVEPTGIAEGYSGSPIWCPDAAGVQRIVGAVSYGTGEYGNLVALATPIEAVLRTPVSTPQKVRVAPSLVRGARPLATPLTVSGLSAPVSGALAAAAKRTSSPVRVAPARARAEGPAPAPVPGGSIAAMFASGDVSYGAIGTVSYVDGEKVWAFGHPLEGVGQRSLLLAEAYIYTVINNPLGTQEAVSYKLAAPGRELGTMTWDGDAAIAGVVGPKPATIPLQVVARDEDRGTRIVTNTSLVDERALGLPGTSAIGLVPPSAVADAMYRVMNGNATAQTANMCISITFASRPKPVKICNRYAGGGGGMFAPAASDVGAATGDIAGFRFGTPVISSIKVDVGIKRGLHAGELRSVTAPPVLRRGRTANLRVRYQQLIDGTVVRRTVKVRIPAQADRGVRELVLSGSSGGSSSDADLEAMFEEMLGISGGSGERKEPHTVAQLVKEIEDLERSDGVTVRLRRPSSKAKRDGAGGSQDKIVGGNLRATAAKGRIAPVLGEGDLSISGRVSTIVVVR